MQYNQINFREREKRMMMTNLYILSRKIHRLLVLIILVIGLLMAGTGMALKYTFLSSSLPFVDLGFVRYLHNVLSPFFAIVFLGMLITGIYMYIFPLLRKK